MNKTSKLISVIIACIIVLSGLTYFFKDDIVGKKADPIKFLPGKSAFVLELRDGAHGFMKELQDSKWKQFLGMYAGGSTLLDHAKYLEVDSIRAAGVKFSSDESIWVAVAPYTNFSPSTIIILPFSIPVDNANSLNWLKHLVGAETAIADEKGICTLSAPNQKMYFKCIDGLSLLSSDLKFLNHSLELGTDANYEEDPEFARLRKTAGKNVDGHLYINFFNASIISEKYIEGAEDKVTNFIGRSANWFAGDVLIRDGDILVSGFSDAGINQYLSVFDNQKPHSANVVKFLPFNTSYLLDVGQSDYKEIYDKYKGVLKSKNQLDGYLKPQYAIENKYHINLNNDLISKVGDEFGMGYCAVSGDKQEAFFFMRSNDNRAMRASLKRIYSKAPGRTKVSDYLGSKIYHIGIKGLVPAVFGELFDAVQYSYVTFVDDYVFIANNKATIQYILRNLGNGKTLDANPNYVSFADNLSGESNVLMYFNIHHALNLVKPDFIDQFQQTLEKNNSAIQGLEALSMEFSSSDDYFFTNFSLRYNPSYKEESSSVWVYSADESITSPLCLVDTHQKKADLLFFADNENTVYLLDGYGALLWKRKIDGEILSKVYCIDYFKNGKLQYLFNTANSLYLVDLHGKDVAAYPLNLATKASNGIELVDYDKNKSYRLLYAGTDQRIYNLDIQGNRIKGWKIPKSDSPITQDIQYLRAGTKDYLVIPTSEGTPLITDRRGKTRIRIKEDLNKAAHSEYYVNQTNSKGIIITTNKNGQLVYIQPNGQLAYTDFGKFSPEHYFLYADIDKKNGNDFIFVDGKRVVVYNRFKKKLLERNLEHEIVGKPELIALPNGKRYLCLATDNQQTLILDDKGQVYHPAFDGGAPFSVGNVSAANIKHLLCVKKNKVYNYSLN